MDKFILLDGNNLAHIAYHRAKSIVLKDKQEKWASEQYDNHKSKNEWERIAKKHVVLESTDYKNIAGMMLLVFFRKLHKHFKKFDGNFVFIWDNENSHEWRQQIYPNYKCGRDYETDLLWKILFENIEEIKKVLSSYPTAQVNVKGLEADDLMYLYSKLLSEINNVVIISSDSDLIQIAQEFKNIKIFHPIKDVYVKIPKDYNIAHYKAIKGDTSDDIDGIKGFGEKKSLKAAQELTNGKSIEKILEESVPKKKEKDAQKIISENKKIFERNMMIIKIGNNPNINDSYFINTSEIKNLTSKINLKSIQKFYFKHNLISLLEEFGNISNIFAK